MRNDSTLCLIVLTGVLALSKPVFAQTPSDTAWRLTSRLGYGPTLGQVSDITKAGDARAWALRQIDAALAASKTPAHIPAWAQRTSLSLAEIFPEFTKEREARKAGQEKLQKSENGEGPAGGANRWDQIASYINNVCRQQIPRTKEECIAVYNQNKTAKAPTHNSVCVAAPKVSIASESTTDEDIWTEEQDKLLQDGLANNPATMDKNERWTNIAKCVPGKTKKQCVNRFKAIRDAIKNKK